MKKIAILFFVAATMVALIVTAQDEPSKKDKQKILAERLRSEIGAAPEANMTFSASGVDVANFVQLVGSEFPERKFVVSADVKGQIFVDSQKISKRNAYPLFVSILESAGCSVVEDGDITRIVPLPEGRMRLGRVIGVDEKTPQEGIVTKVLRLENVMASALKKALEPQVGGKGTSAISAIDETNHLIITDTARNVREIEKIISDIDKPGLAKVTEVVPLKFSAANELAQQLNMAMAESESRGERLRKRLPNVNSAITYSRFGAVVVASGHSNSLILVGSPSEILVLKSLIAQMDVDIPSGRGRLNAIFLKYISALDAAKSITTLLDKSMSKGKLSTSISAERKKITIEASVVNNALLVDASPGDFDVVKKLIEQIDIIPEQVHITVIIVEQSVTTNLNFGLEMQALDMPSILGDTVVQGSVRLGDTAGSLMNDIQGGLFPRGLTAGIAHGSSRDVQGNMVVGYPGVVNIDAMKREGKFEIMSETSLVSQNNREATVSIVNDIPILKSTVEGGSGTARDIIQNIERLEVGIKLKLVPNIVPNGEVQMVLNPSIEAVIDSGPAGTQFTPTIARREVSTSVTVKDGEMIVIAGLTRDDERTLQRKVPFLGSIPLLGWLFKYKEDITEKVNLLIFVTPRIVKNSAVAEAVVQEMQNRTGLKINERKPTVKQ